MLKLNGNVSSSVNTFNELTVVIPPYSSMVGILSLLCLCLYGYGFLSGGKRYQCETLHACSTTIRDEHLPFWLTLA